MTADLWAGPSPAGTSTLPLRVGSCAGELPCDWDDRSTWAPALRGLANYVRAPAGTDVWSG